MNKAPSKIFVKELQSNHPNTNSGQILDKTASTRLDKTEYGSNAISSSRKQYNNSNIQIKKDISSKDGLQKNSRTNSKVDVQAYKGNDTIQKISSSTKNHLQTNSKVNLKVESKTYTGKNVVHKMSSKTNLESKIDSKIRQTSKPKITSNSKVDSKLHSAKFKQKQSAPNSSSLANLKASSNLKTAQDSNAVLENFNTSNLDYQANHEIALQIIDRIISQITTEANDDEAQMKNYRKLDQSANIDELIERARQQYSEDTNEIDNYYIDFSKMQCTLQSKMTLCPLRKFMTKNAHPLWKQYDALLSQADNYWKILTNYDKEKSPKHKRRKRKKLRKDDDEFTQLYNGSIISGEAASVTESYTDDSWTEDSESGSDEDHSETDLDASSINKNQNARIDEDRHLMNSNQHLKNSSNDSYSDSTEFGMSSDSDDELTDHSVYIKQWSNKLSDAIKGSLNSISQFLTDSYPNANVQLDCKFNNDYFVPKTTPKLSSNYTPEKISICISPIGDAFYSYGERVYNIKRDLKRKDIILVIYEQICQASLDADESKHFQKSVANLMKILYQDKDIQSIQTDPTESIFVNRDRTEKYALCVWSMNNLSQPSATLSTNILPTCIVFHPLNSNIVAVGYESGEVQILSISNIRSIVQLSTLSADIYDTDYIWPVCQIEFIPVDIYTNDQLLLICRNDGSLEEWLFDEKFTSWKQRGAIGKTINDILLRTSFPTRMRISRYSREHDPVEAPIFCGFNFAAFDRSLILIRKPSGLIASCSSNKSVVTDRKWKGHVAPVKKIDFNPFNPNVFLSLSIDGEIFIWYKDYTTPVYNLDRSLDVTFDVQWSDKYANVLMVMTCCSLEFWDLYAILNFQTYLIKQEFQHVEIKSNYGYFSPDRKEIILSFKKCHIFIYTITHNYDIYNDVNTNRLLQEVIDKCCSVNNDSSFAS
ncbi:hypothetical protein GJ496_004330 [Pomphorhynchus laevis]|nr:hypothetical protein GJ496_004330 [Pomphorhynchus laevis]